MEIEKAHVVYDQGRNISPLRLSRRLAAFEREVASPAKVDSPVRRRHSKSPYKLQRDDHADVLPLPPARRHISPLLSRPPGSEARNNVSPFSKSERRRHVSPFQQPTRMIHGVGNDEFGGLSRKQVRRVAKDDSSRAAEKSNYGHRSASAPRPRPRDKDQQVKYDQGEQKISGRTLSLLSRNEREGAHKNSPSVGELNEMMANAKISRGLVGDVPPIMESTDSTSPGDIFFSRDYGAVTMQKIVFPKNGGFESNLSPNSNRYTEKSYGSHQQSSKNGGSNLNTQGNNSSNVLTRTSSVTSSGVSRQASNISDASDRTTASARKFADNRRKSQTEAWFSCIKNGYCRTSKRSHERERAFDEASFIEKAFVVESLRQFWADKHQPASLNGFSCHKQEAQLLKHLVSISRL